MTDVFDVDTTNNKINVLEEGTYTISEGARTANDPGSSSKFVVLLNVNGSLVREGAVVGGPILSVFVPKSANQSLRFISSVAVG